MYKVPSVEVLEAECVAAMLAMEAESVDAVVTDPPYELGFMGRSWDSTGIAFRLETWQAALRVLRPGGYLVAFGAPKNAHRLTCAIEDAGFEIRDTLMWLFGTGFPKSHDVSKGIDRAASAMLPRIAGGVGSKGGETYSAYGGFVAGETISGDAVTPDAIKWQGWGTALKPAYEPIILARKPLIGTVVKNVLAHGTGALNIDGCRIGTDGGTSKSPSNDKSRTVSVGGYLNAQAGKLNGKGRWPANVVHDGSDEVLAGFPETGPSTATAGIIRHGRSGGIMGEAGGIRDGRPEGYNDPGGSAARFFYCAKASTKDRVDSKHPTVKPIALMRWLCRLVTPPGGIILDPFAGTGTTGQAALDEGFSALLIEREPEYIADIRRRLAASNTLAVV